MPLDAPVRHDTSGFTLLEVLIALGLFVAIAIGVAQLTGIATRAARLSRDHSSAIILAASKMDQLGALEWSYESTAPGDPPIPRTDVTTNLSAAGISNDGSGLQPSPVNSLRQNTPPFVDYLDRDGRWVGNGPDPPPAAVFVRRWSITPLPAHPERTLVLRVVVTTIAQDRLRTGSWHRRSGADVLLVSVKTRKAG
jgi:type II secretory pathway pseudopilin PulG